MKCLRRSSSSESETVQNASRYDTTMSLASIPIILTISFHFHIDYVRDGLHSFVNISENRQPHVRTLHSVSALSVFEITVN